MKRSEKQQPETQLQESLNTALFNLECMFNDASLIPLMKVHDPIQCVSLLESLTRAYQALNIASLEESEPRKSTPALHSDNSIQETLNQIDEGFNLIVEKHGKDNPEWVAKIGIEITERLISKITNQPTPTEV